MSLMPADGDNRSAPHNDSDAKAGQWAVFPGIKCETTGLIIETNHSFLFLCLGVSRRQRGCVETSANQGQVLVAPSIPERVYCQNSIILFPIGTQG